MTQVFLNYRASDEPHGVAMLDQGLSQRFGSDAVFLASKSIPLGADWREGMFAAVRESVALLVVMGRHWLDASDENGRRLDNPDDFVRLEIELALSLGKKVIPVRLGVPRLKPAQLPASLVPMLGRQDIEVRFRNYVVDVDHLAEKLRVAIPELRDARPPEPRPGGGKYTVIGDVGNVMQSDKIVFKDGVHVGPRYGSSRGDA